MIKSILQAARLLNHTVIKAAGAGSYFLWSLGERNTRVMLHVGAWPNAGNGLYEFHHPPPLSSYHIDTGYLKTSYEGQSIRKFHPSMLLPFTAEAWASPSAFERAA